MPRGYPQASAAEPTVRVVVGADALSAADSALQKALQNDVHAAWQRLHAPRSAADVEPEQHVCLHAACQIRDHVQVLGRACLAAALSLRVSHARTCSTCVTCTLGVTWSRGTRLSARWLMAPMRHMMPHLDRHGHGPGPNSGRRKHHSSHTTILRRQQNHAMISSS